MAVKIRAIDIQILNLLIIDASLTNKEIADKIKRSETTVAKHRRYLVTSGLILSYTIRLDRRKLIRAVDRLHHIDPAKFNAEDYRRLDTEIVNNDDMTTYSFSVNDKMVELVISTDVISTHRKIERNIYEFGKAMKPPK